MELELKNRSITPFIAKSICNCIAYFDWEKVVRIEDFLNGVTDTEGFEDRVFELKEKTIENIFDFIDDIEPDEDEKWVEFRMFKFEFYRHDGVNLIYQPEKWLDTIY